MKKLNALHMELNETVNAYCVTEILEDYITLDEYREIMKNLFNLIREEENRIKNTKGKIRNQHLKEGKIYNVEEFENDIIRENLVKDYGAYYRLIPKYRTKYEYTSYDFKRIDYERVQFIERINHC